MTLFCELSIRFIYKISISVELLTLVLTHCALGNRPRPTQWRRLTASKQFGAIGSLALDRIFKSEMRGAEGHSAKSAPPPFVTGPKIYRPT